jgi:hypothetical protein
MDLKNSLFYLASLYSLDTKNKTDALREARYQHVKLLTAKMLADGWLIFSPIAYCHAMVLDHELPGEWPFWERIDETFIKACDRLLVLQQPGIERSVGINAEIAIAKKFNKPIHTVVFDGGNYYIDP